MSEHTKTFLAAALAVAQLREAFPALRAGAGIAETAGQLSYGADLGSGRAGVDWCRQSLDGLAEALLPLGSRLTLAVTAHDLAFKLLVRGRPGALEADCESVEPAAAPASTLTAEAFAAFMSLQEVARPDAVGLELASLLDLLETMADGGGEIGVELALYLDKSLLERRILAGIPDGARPRLSLFLFPEALLAELERESLADFERQFCEKDRRAVILVPGLAGSLEGPLLVVAGRDMAGELDALLSQPPPGAVLEAARKTLAFRAEQTVWLFPTAWLTPDTFAFAARDGAAEPLRQAIARELRSFQALLAVIFLADHVEREDGRHRVEFSGFGRVRLPLARKELMDHEAAWPALVQLQAYSYEGHSPDKLEIAQQFLSLIVEDLETLCRKAGEVEGATRKTYAKALVDKVGAYFDARQKIQDRIAAAVAEASASVIGLSRDASSDLYKVAGVIVAATAGALLDPGITAAAVLLAAIVIGGYAGIVLGYHLPTLERAYELRMAQHSQYIESFKEILRDDEWQAYLSDDHLGQARGLFAEKVRQTRRLYQAAVVLAGLVMLVALVLLLTAAPAPTP